jgi:DNA-directed RNA polymerase
MKNEYFCIECFDGVKFYLKPSKLKEKVKKHPSLYEGYKSFKIHSVEKTFDASRIKSSMLPNFIHSIDATVCRLLHKNIYEKYRIDVHSIHDCFGSHANHMHLIDFELKDIYIKIFKDSKTFIYKHFIKPNLSAIQQNPKSKDTLDLFLKD